MYRALAAVALDAGTPAEDAGALVELAHRLRFTLEGEDPPSLQVEGYTEADLSSVEVESTVSTVARHAAVRTWMRERQRELAAHGAVLEGRDIATAVFPEARVKLFLRASGDARGARRATQRGADDAAGIAEALRVRDAHDARTNPLEPTADAVIIDTGALDIAASLDAALAAVRRVWPEDAP
jgi:cytidylate kinase